MPALHALPLAALLLATSLPPGTTLSVDQGSSTIRYHVEHTLHHVEGASKQVEGKTQARADGNLLAMVRAPISSFTSGDSNRDAHMLEVLDADRFPDVVFRGIARLPPGAATAGSVEMRGEVELHGKKSPVTLTLTVEGQPDGSLRARGSFEVSLDAHQVERPALLFVKVADACKIDVDLVLRRSDQ